MARLLRPVMKIISVMPAAAASSTAYWMSGLSTTGSISLGLALVTGRKRLPRPATGNTALVTLPDAMDQALQLFFVQYSDAQCPGAFQLAAGFGAGDDVIRFLRYASRDLAAVALDQLRRFLARHGGQRARQHEGEIGELAARRTLRRAFGPLYPGGAQLSNHLAVVFLGEELPDALCKNGPYVVHFEERRLVGGY